MFTYLCAINTAHEMRPQVFTTLLNSSKCAENANLLILFTKKNPNSLVVQMSCLKFSKNLIHQVLSELFL